MTRRAPPRREASHAPAATAAEFSAQVRGMFDRIAGVYDLMNTAMTAGLHHRWRERAPPTAPSSGRATARSTSAAGPATSRSSSRRRVGPRGGSSAATSPSRCSSWRGARRPRGAVRRRVRVGRRARASATRTARFDAVTVGFGVRNLADLDARPGGDGARAATRRAARDPRDHAAAAPAAVELLLAVVRPPRPAARRRWRATATPTPTCRSRCSAFPAPERLAALMDARRARAASAGCSSPAGSSRSTAGCGR